MGPGERSIQHELRRQAAQVAIPTEMWEQISGRLDVKRVRAQRQRQVTMRSSQWKPALALMAAVGMLWLTAAPTGSAPEPQAATNGTAHPRMARNAWGHDTLSVRLHPEAGYDGEGNQPGARPSTADRSSTADRPSTADRSSTADRPPMLRSRRMALR